MAQVTVVPEVGSLRMIESENELIMGRFWVRAAQEHWPAGRGGFPTEGPVLEFLVEGTEVAHDWAIPRQESLALSFGTQYFHWEASSSPARQSPPDPIYEFLTVPEYRWRSWVFGRMMHLIEQGSAYAETVSASSDGGAIAIDDVIAERNRDLGVLCETYRFASLLDGSNIGFLVRKLSSNVVTVTRARISRGVQVDFDTLTLTQPGDLVMRISARSRCQFCAEKNVQCECSSTFRQRLMLDPKPYTCWEELIAHQADAQSGDQVGVMDIKAHLSYPDVPSPHIVQMSSMHFRNDPVMRRLRSLFVHAASRTHVNYDARLLPPTHAHEHASGPPILEDTSAMSASNRFSCSRCRSTFTTKGSLGRHQKTVHGLILFSCDTCGRAFSQKGNLKRHKVVVHQMMRDWICKECNAAFASSANLKRHLTTVHPISSGL